jgi:hypothetical protein
MLLQPSPGGYFETSALGEFRQFFGEIFDHGAASPFFQMSKRVNSGCAY